VSADPRVGPVEPDDAGELFTVQRAAYVSEAQRYGFVIPPLLETFAELRKELANPAVLCHGAWLGTRLVGSVRGRVADASMEIARFAVAPDVQGRGVGRALLTSIEAATPADVDTFWLVTGSLSVDNIRFYERSGYRRTDTILDPIGIEIVRMRKFRNR
jgi:ribosomal protein S18 acetylase RimI-like enzyme